MKTQMRALSPLIATVLLIAITVAAGLIVYTYFSSTANICRQRCSVSLENVQLVELRAEPYEGASGGIFSKKSWNAVKNGNFTEPKVRIFKEAFVNGSYGYVEVDAAGNEGRFYKYPQEMRRMPAIAYGEWKVLYNRDAAKQGFGPRRISFQQINGKTWIVFNTSGIVYNWWSGPRPVILLGQALYNTMVNETTRYSIRIRVLSQDHPNMQPTTDLYIGGWQATPPDTPSGRVNFTSESLDRMVIFAAPLVGNELFWDEIIQNKVKNGENVIGDDRMWLDLDGWYFSESRGLDVQIGVAFQSVVAYTDIAVYDPENVYKNASNTPLSLFTATIKNTGTKAIIDLEVQMDDADWIEVPLPNNVLQPGACAAVLTYIPQKFVIGEWYKVTVHATARDGSEFAYATTVTCWG